MYWKGKHPGPTPVMGWSRNISHVVVKATKRELASASTSRAFAACVSVDALSRSGAYEATAMTIASGMTTATTMPRRRVTQKKSTTAAAAAAAIAVIVNVAAMAASVTTASAIHIRSEERRVGKGCRARGSRWHAKG